MDLSTVTFYGHGMEDFGRYRRAGVNIGIGTDVAPHNLIEEMRLAAIVARILAENIKTTTTAEVFRATRGSLYNVNAVFAVESTPPKSFSSLSSISCTFSRTVG